MPAVANATRTIMVADVSIGMSVRLTRIVAIKENALILAVHRFLVVSATVIWAGLDPVATKVSTNVLK